MKWIDSKSFDSNKHSSKSSNWCVLKVDLEYPKDLNELRNEYILVILFNLPLKIADFYRIAIGNVKTLVAVLIFYIILRLKEPAYIEMCILNLDEVLMRELRYDYIINLTS